MVSPGIHTTANARSGANYNRPAQIWWLYFPACLYAVFVVYGSLVPLNFTAMPLEEAIAQFRQIRFLKLGIGSRADWVANGLLMIPLAFLICGSAWGQTRSARLAAAVVTLLFCVSLGIAIEFIQLFFPPRTVSQNDVFAQTVGSVAGVLLWWQAGALYLSYIERFQASSGTQSVSEKALWGYLAMVYGYSLLPLDLTISPVEIFHKWSEGKVVLIPFSALPKAPVEFMYELSTDAVLWLPVSLLLVLSAKKRATGAIVWTVAVAALLEALQLFVYSRVSDITDIFTALAGAIAGVAVAHRLRDTKSANPVQVEGPWQRVALGFFLFCLWTLVLMLVFWYPYDFNFDGGFLRQRVQRFADVPFQSYYLGTEFRAITELSRRILFFMPLGVILRLTATGTAAPVFTRVYTAASLLALLCVAAAIELGQTALPDKFPNNTDVLLQFIGAALGYFAAAFVRDRVAETPATQAETAPAPTHHALAASAPAPAPPTETWNMANTALMVFTLLLASWLVSALLASPAIPYNIRELVAGDFRWLRVAGLLTTCCWVFGAPLAILQARLCRPGRVSADLPGPVPGFIAFHTLATWPLVWLVFPLESIHDIIGAPVWESFRSIELSLRFCGLFLLPSTIIWSTSAILLSQIYAVRCRKGPLIVVMSIALTLSYLVVVQLAGTDNLVELLAGRGASWRVLWVPAYLAVLIYCGLSLPFIPRFRSQKRWAHLLLLLVSAPLGYWFLLQGLEQFIVKYGRVFSALQFLLSANRESYLAPGPLFMRFCIAHYALIFAISLLQSPLWLRWWSRLFAQTSTPCSIHKHGGRP